MTRNILTGGGVYLVDYYARRGYSVLLAERENILMCRASFNNQARVHNGYHYPRSVLTAQRSRVSFPRFCRDFGGAAGLSKFYMVSRLQSHITAA